MKIDGEKHRLTVKTTDLSGSAFDDVNLCGYTYENVDMSGGANHDSTFDDLNMFGRTVTNDNFSGLRLESANLAGASIMNCRLHGMTIDGVEVVDLIAARKEREARDNG